MGCGLDCTRGDITTDQLDSPAWTPGCSSSLVLAFAVYVCRATSVTSRVDVNTRKIRTGMRVRL
jgi:hypothetical protein